MNLQSRQYLAMLIFCLAGGLLVQAQDIGADAQHDVFDELSTRIQQRPEAATEDDVLRIMTMGENLGRNVAASLAIKSYLIRQEKPTPRLVQAAVKCAMLAGDYRTAIARCKAYLKTEGSGGSAPALAATMLTAQVDYLHAKDDAYRFVFEHGEKYRQSTAFRKFDGWFLAEARRRYDYAAVSRQLVRIFSNKLPLEQERFLYWDDLDWLMDELRRTDKSRFAAVPSCRRLVPLIRGDAARARRLNFQTEYLAFKAGMEGKEQEQLDKEFARVKQAAEAYVRQKTTTDTVGIVIQVFCDNNDPNHGWRKTNEQALKRGVFVSLFNLLPPPEQKKMVAWKYPPWNAPIPTYIANQDQWADLGRRYPAAFKGTEAGAKALLSSSKDPAFYKKQGQLLAGVRTREAAIINAMGAGDTFDAIIDHLVKKESWHLAGNDVFKIIDAELWPRFKAYPRDDANQLSADYHARAMVKFGSQHLAKSPLALDAKAGAAYMLGAMQGSGANADDKSKVAGHLAALNWVPYTAEERKAVFQPAEAAFKRWSDDIRARHADAEKQIKTLTPALDTDRQKLAALRQQKEQNRLATVQKTQARAAADPKDTAGIGALTKELTDLSTAVAALEKKIAELDKAIKKQEGKFKENNDIVARLAGALQQIGPVDAALRAAKARTPAARSAGPNPMCEQYAKLIIAQRAKNQAGFEAAARALYPLVKAYHTQKTPLGWSVLTSILTPPSDVNIIDFQAEVLDQALQSWNAAGDNDAIIRVVDAIGKSGPSWNWWGIPARDREKSIKLNVVLARAVTAQLNKGQLPKEIFNWMLGTRRGSGWEDRELNVDIMERIIKENTLVDKSSYRTGGSTAATTYIHLLDYQFGEAIRKAHPKTTDFVDMYVEEVKRTGKVDFGYWQYSGGDVDHKIYNMLATIAQGYATLPTGYGGTEADMSLASYWSLTSRALSAEPAVRDAALAKMESYYGTTRFDSYAMGSQYFVYTAKAATPEDRKDYFDRYAAYLDRVAKSPWRPSSPALGMIYNFKKFSPAEIEVLIQWLSPHSTQSRWPPGWHFDSVARNLVDNLVGDQPDPRLYELAPQFWRIARDTGDGKTLQKMLEIGQGLHNDGHHDLAVAWSKAGLGVLGQLRSGEIIGGLGALHSRALSNIRGVIPVKRSDPRYPLFSAQANFNAGNRNGAWTEFLQGQDVLLEYFRELDPLFCSWLIDRSVELENFDEATELAQALITDMDSKVLRLSDEARVRILLSYANIFFNRPDLPKARAQYEKIAADNDFDDLAGQIDAELRVVEVDRLQKDFDGAISRIDKILLRKDPYATIEGNYHLALIHRDQQQYDEALDSLNEVFSMEPHHVNGVLLQGRINLKLKNLEQAIDLQLGLNQKQMFVVPGKILRVRVDDKLRRIVKRTSSIEISIRSSSGDEELFTLVPWADSLTRFEGEIATALGPVEKGDRILQLLGSDEVYYDFSERFKKEHQVTSSSDHALRVISDSGLYASSGEILTEAELEEMKEEAMILRRLQRQGRVTKAEERLLSDVRPGSQVKPGNNINVRVVDDDQSKTAENDSIIVRVSTSSGDSIQAFRLQETETHSGTFEGAIKTESAPATAFATDSDEGTDPNFPISGGEYPPWVALPDNKRPKHFGIDLNGSVFPSKMRIEAGVPGRKLKEFFLQSSLNGRDYDVIGSWPKALKGWDGSPRGVVARLGKIGIMPAGDALLSQLDQKIQATRNTDKREISIRTLSVSWDSNIFGHRTPLRLNSTDIKEPNAWYVARFSAAFYTPMREHRTFQLKTAGTGEAAQYVMAIDGAIGSTQNEASLGTQTSHEFKGVFKKGVHRIDVYVLATPSSAPRFQVQHDIEEAPYMAVCPPDMFDTEKHPEIRRQIYKEPAAIESNEDASAFDITFSEGTRSRVFRLIIFDFETDAPAINRIVLNSIDGTQVLPTEMDLMELRYNDILEIIPGDRITVTYEDPTSIGENSRIREANLSATYANAQISPHMVIGYLTAPDGSKIPERSLMRRYKPGDSIDIEIMDPDMDVSKKRDSVEITVRTTVGEPRKLTAIETENHSGAFEVRIFPVEENPERDTDILVTESDDIIMEYMDKENTEPGIPWVRAAVVEQVWYQEPEVRAFSVTSMPFKVAAVEEGEVLLAPQGLDELHPVTYTMVGMRPQSPEKPQQPDQIVHGGPMIVELLWPTIAQHVASTADIFVQTAAGRAAAGIAPDAPFDIRVPGTIKVVGSYGTASGSAAAPHGYQQCLIVGSRYAGDPLDDGRFIFNIPVALGVLSEDSYAVDLEDDPLRAKGGDTLMVDGDETIYIGFNYSNDVGQSIWVTRDMVLTGDPFFNVMERDYLALVEGRFVDESVHFRVRDAMKDLSDRRDEVELLLMTSSGQSNTIKVTETMNHSGTFKGLVKFVYAAEEKMMEDYNPGEMPVKFGDRVTITYMPKDSRIDVAHAVEIFKGADGDLIPFTKHFTDPEIAVKTQFSIAEAYFEMAKKHRRLGQKEVTQREIATGKKVLEEALRDYPESEARAQGDYLLANLSLELAEEIEDGKEKRGYFNEALLRFTKIVGRHRDSSYAPKAQFKKALTLERMGDFDAACEEYVKLSYRWPDNELIAETIARLGQYFFRKGKGLLEIETDDPLEKEKAKMTAHNMFTTAAEVFGRMVVRFPQHKLAEKTTVLSGQCYMRAEKFNKAVEALTMVIDNSDADKEVRAEAMYWCADSFTKLKQLSRPGQAPPLSQAFRMFKRLTWDYPSSKWAKYARGRLTEPQISSAGEDA